MCINSRMSVYAFWCTNPCMHASGKKKCSFCESIYVFKHSHTHRPSQHQHTYLEIPNDYLVHGSPWGQRMSVLVHHVLAASALGHTLGSYFECQPQSGMDDQLATQSQSVCTPDPPVMNAHGCVYNMHAYKQRTHRSHSSLHPHMSTHIHTRIYIYIHICMHTYIQVPYLLTRRVARSDNILSGAVGRVGGIHIAQLHAIDELILLDFVLCLGLHDICGIEQGAWPASVMLYLCKVCTHVCVCVCLCACA